MAEGARLESVYTATYRGFESPLTAIFKEELVRKYEFFRILSACTAVNANFHSLCKIVPFCCLYGSELKYYTFSPLLIKQNHLIFLLSPFFILTFSSSTNYQQLTFTSKNRVFTVPPHK